jgi:precorrin-4/cobalt-precorrin-4 C11-methyltransferase
VKAAKLTRTALILVGHVLDAQEFRDSALYDAGHEHVLRNRKTVKA